MSVNCFGLMPASQSNPNTFFFIEKLVTFSTRMLLMIPSYQSHTELIRKCVEIHFLWEFWYKNNVALLIYAVVFLMIVLSVIFMVVDVLLWFWLSGSLKQR